MSFFQISAVLFALFMLYVIRITQRKLVFSPLETLFWYSLWILFIILAIAPHLLTGVSELFFFDRVFDLLIVGAFMVISFIAITTSFKLRETQLKLSEIVREMAKLKLTHTKKAKK